MDATDADRAAGDELVSPVDDRMPGDELAVRDGFAQFDLADLDISQGKPIAESIAELFRKFDSGLLTSDNLYP